MKKFVLVSIGLILMSGVLSLSLEAQASVTSQVFAEVIPALTATETAQLNFGRFSPGNQGGQIIVSPEGVVSTLGSVVVNSGSINAANYYLTGDSRTTFTITLPAGPVILTNTGDSKTMTVSNWNSVPGTSTTIGNLQSGSRIVKVGATLSVGLMNDNPEGIYTGSYTISFDYN